ncbi:hypothetical protein [Nocardioides sp.]|uniref:hypothetical protein n=1 Tax=Nocardioides sp. TaxID=35761 RepID=UPI0035649ECA
MTESEPRPHRPRRHLMDPANPRRRSAPAMSMTSVQRWVMSVLAVTTVGHFAGGLVVAAVFIDPARQGARIGLTVIAGVVGVLGIAAAFLIHQRNPLTPWLVAGLLPAVVGFVLILG